MTKITTLKNVDVPAMIHQVVPMAIHEAIANLEKGKRKREKKIEPGPPPFNSNL
jgi:hypothetical protein